VYTNLKTKIPTKKNKSSVSVASSSAAKGYKEAMDSMKGMDTMMGRVMVHLKPPTKKQAIDDDVSSLPVNSSSSASKKKKHLAFFLFMRGQSSSAQAYDHSTLSLTAFMLSFSISCLWVSGSCAVGSCLVQTQVQYPAKIPSP
jgi:hypothetical protein